MNYTAKLLLGGHIVMTRHGRTRREAIEAVGGTAGPGYRIVVERVGVLG